MMADRKKVIKALELCISKHQCCMESPDEHCPYEEWLGEYEDSFYECTSLLAKDALELLKSQPEVVRCKDCKYYDCFNGCMSWHDVNSSNPDWFCADGERK